MKKRGKGDGNTSHRKAPPPRIKSLWIRGHKDVERIFIQDEERPNSKLKKGARNMAEAFPQSNEEVLRLNPKPEPSGKKAKVLQFKKPVGRVHMDHPPDRNIQVLIQKEKDWHRKMTCLVAEEKLFVSDSEADARITIELRTHYSGKAGHWRDPEYRQSVEEVTECASNTSIKPDNTRKSVSSGYGFAHKKPVIKTGLSPSGKPISDFLEGGKYPPPSAIPHAVNAAEEELDTGYRWHKNNMPKEYLTDLYYEYEELLKDHSRMLIDYQCEVEELHDCLLQKQSYIEELEAEVKAQDNELSLKQQEINLINWSAAYRQDATNTQAPPLKVANKSLASIASEFNTYKKLYEDNPLRSFIRERGYSFEVEKQLRDHFDSECKKRLEANTKRKATRDMVNEFLHGHAQLHNRKLAVAREVLALRRIGDKVTTGNINGKRYKVANRNSHLLVKAERKTFKRWSLQNRDSLLNRRLNDRLDYQDWWMNNITPTEVELRVLKSSKYYGPAKAIVGTWHGIKNVMTKERQYPWNIKKANKLAEEQALAKKQRKEKSIAKQKAKQLQHEQQLIEAEQRKKLRKAMSIAY